MKKIIAVFICVIILSLSVFAKPNYKRITFKKGATSVIVTGRLNGYKDKLYYVIRLRAGQRLQISSNQYITLAELSDPAGEDVMDRAANCNKNADVSPTVAGDYKITVIECKKADAWRGSFKMKITVTDVNKVDNSSLPSRVEKAADSPNSPMAKAFDVSELTSEIEKTETEYKYNPNVKKVKMSVASAYFKRAFALTDHAQYRAAIGDFRKGLKLNPSDTEAKEMYDQIISIFKSIGREPPKEGEEPAPIPFTDND